MKVDPRFLADDGPEIFTGNELLLKGALETEGGVHLLGGYPGSPVAGFFDAMAYVKDLLSEKGIRAVINNNEALSAAMLNGSQVAGCRGMIVMKSVGVHVAADALALGNLAGAHREGGAVVVYGDDPWSDSTQVASDSRYISKHLQIPVVEPSNTQEIKDFVGLAFKLSAEAELYVGFVLTNNLADGGGTVHVRPNQYPAFNTRQLKTLDSAAIDVDKFVLLPPKTWWQEESLPDRFERAVSAARRLGLNRIEYPAKTRCPVGFVTSGLAHGYLLQSLEELDVLGKCPVLKFGLTYPVDTGMVRELASQCERIVVVEERRGFLEEQISESLARDRQTGALEADVELWGKHFPEGLEGIPATRGLLPSIVTARLAPLLKRLHAAPSKGETSPVEGAWDREMAAIDETARKEMPALPTRLPTFCPGCPHRDTANLCLVIKRDFMDKTYMNRRHHQDPVDLIFHGDTGCYTMLMYPPNTSLMHDYSGMGLGGGTGSGMDPFITNKQVVFMGDSTFFHSGQIAISQAVKLGQDLTFIILDNSTTAMTGHQPTPGVDYDILGNETPSQNIEDVVNAICGGDGDGMTVFRADPEQRAEYRRLLERTFLTDGVKVIIADKECGITRGRRQRRLERDEVKQRGYLAAKQYMNINHEVCRYCLACVELTGCPGLAHVDTEYGPKMSTSLTWCVNDGACERIGACSAFERVTVRRKRSPRSRIPELDLENIPEPHNKRSVDDLWRCCLVGVGGMGIGVATSIVLRAGHKEGYDVVFVDKKGLAIRNGGVVSQVVYNVAKRPITALIPYGKADLLIGVDVLEAARAIDPTGRTRAASPRKTSAVVNTDKVLTIRGVMDQEDFDVAELERIIRANTRAEDYMARDIARICEKYLGSKMYTNCMMLGFAFQKGLIPVSMHSMAWAIKDTIRTDFRKNLYAFNMGRKLVERPDLFQGPPCKTSWRDALEAHCRSTIRRYARGHQFADELRALVAGLLRKASDLDESLKRAIVVRTYDCMRWGGMEYARRYARRLREVYEKDRAEYGYAATRAAVYNLADAMLIKDLVYLAELSTSPEKYARDRAKYDVNPSNGDRIRYRHMMHVPISLGRWDFKLNFTASDLKLKALKRMHWLRKLPGWNGEALRYLADYERLLEEFAYSDTEEYRHRMARLSSARCMQCENPRCRDAGCPLENAIPDWIDLAYRHEWRQASERLHQTNNFPEFTAAICPAPCQTACKQGTNGYPVRIREIEQQIIDRAFAEGWITPQTQAQATNRRVAIVGSGPAGLAAAQQLVRAGHTVTVFDSQDQPGGLLRDGIPAFRLDKALIDRRLDQLRAEGVEFRTGTRVGKDISAEKLREDYDAICLATGAQLPRDLQIPGREREGVLFALDYLRAQSRGDGAKALNARGKSVVVIGGGETGNDCVETALLQGAREVRQLEILPEGGAEVDLTHPAPAGVERRWSVTTKRFNGNGSGLQGLSAAEVRWIRSPRGDVMEEIPGSEFDVQADLAILAVGFERATDADLAHQLGLATDQRGAPVTTGCTTGVEGVFVAGDLAQGASLVVRAIQSGREAAAAIDLYLRS
jgi:indolepyruvate ferredoxin oxidoreductase